MPIKTLLSIQQVQQAWSMYQTESINLTEVAARFNVSYGTMLNHLKRLPDYRKISKAKQGGLNTPLLPQQIQDTLRANQSITYYMFACCEHLTGIIVVRCLSLEQANQAAQQFVSEVVVLNNEQWRVEVLDDTEIIKMIETTAKAHFH